MNVQVDKSSGGGGVGFTGLLFLTFLVLKLTGVINWSWWWVTALALPKANTEVGNSVGLLGAGLLLGGLALISVVFLGR